MTDRFSHRRGLIGTDAEIRVRDDAPRELRSVFVDIAYESGVRPSRLRALVCKVLRVAADPNNWSEFPNVDMEVRDHVDSCEWFHIYDLIEEVSRSLPADQANSFGEEINKYFRQRGIGWQLAGGLIEVRGPEHFESAVRETLGLLDGSGRSTAHGELREALRDLSRRPDPDETGAIQHAMAALECVARDISGDHNATLGKIISNHPNLIPKPLDQAVDKAWGYASDKGRHLKEGNPPSYEDAELIVNISGAVCSYLLHKEQSRPA